MSAEGAVVGARGAGGAVGPWGSASGGAALATGGGELLLGSSSVCFEVLFP